MDETVSFQMCIYEFDLYRSNKLYWNTFKMSAVVVFGNQLCKYMAASMPHVCVAASYSTPPV